MKELEKAKKIKNKEGKKLMNVRLTTAEIEELKNAGFGCATSGLRRMMAMFRNRKDKS